MPFSLRLPYSICSPVARIARRFAGARPPERFDQSAYVDYQYRTSERMMQRFMRGLELHGKTVLDVGCGLGGRAPFWIEQGASRVIGIDINRQELSVGREILRTKFPGISDRIELAHASEMAIPEVADVAIMIDVFEHLVDPLAVLRECYDWLRPGGSLWSGSIGWYNYLASHCLGHVPIPWCQILFSERAILETIRAVLHAPNYRPNVWEQLEGLGRWDNVQSLRERPGEPLNMLSLRAVRRLVHSSPFRVEHFKVYGFNGGRSRVARSAAFLARVPIAREVFHSYYTMLLVKDAEPHRN